MATLITRENYAVDNTRGLLEQAPVFVRHFNELVTDVNVGGSFVSYTTQALAANNTVVYGDLGTAVYSSGVVLGTDAQGKYVSVTAAGTYSFDFTLQYFKNNITSEGTMTGWLATNPAGVVTAPTNIDGTANSASLAISSQLTIMTLHSHLVLNAGDKVYLLFAGNSSTTPGLFADLQLRTSVASAPYPRIAAISLEVDKVR